MFHFEFMQRAMLASVMISLFAPVLGLFLILRRQSLVADTLAHVSLSGVALGFFLGLNPTWTTALVVVLLAFLLEYLRQIYKDYSELSMAFLMAGGMSIALVLSSFNERSTMGIDQFLFGSIVTISSEQIFFLAVLTSLVIGGYLLFKKPMYVLTFDEEAAFVQGLPVRLMSSLFMILTGLAISLMMPIVGSLLVSAILIFPAAIAMRHMKKFNSVILLGITIAMIGMFSGLYVSYHYGTPPGATIVLVYLALLFISIFTRKIREH